jgi:hypothetical protein
MEVNNHCKDKKNLIADNISDQKLRLTVITKDDI